MINPVKSFLTHGPSKRTRGNMSIADQEPGLIRRQWLLIS